MVLRNRLRLAATTAAAAAILAGCVWVDEEAPTGVRHPPAEYEAQLLLPYEGYDTRWMGFTTPTTREISDFVGTEKFRMALVTRNSNPTLSDWYFVLNPGDADSMPRLLGYASGGTFRYTDSPHRIEACRLSPDGNALIYSKSPATFGWQPSALWMQTLSGRDWLVPLAARANRSQGMLGMDPFWHVEEGRQVILFAGIGELDGRSGAVVQETRLVERLSDSSVSAVEPLRREGMILEERITGITRGNRWVLLRKHGGDFLVASERLGESGYLASADSLRPATVGAGASLNPFDPSRTAHTDYYATLPFSIPSGEDSLPDTSLSPHALDGKPGSHPDHASSIWICDQDRNIILSQELPEGDGTSASWVHWTNHPNFVVAGRGGRVYLIKLAADAGALQENPEASTLKAAGVFRLVSPQADPSVRVSDVSVWIDDTP